MGPRFVALALALAACHRARPSPRPDVHDQELALPLADSGPRVPAPPAPCTIDDTRWRIPQTGPGAPTGTIEGGTVVHTNVGDWLAWIDRGTSAIVVSPPTGDPMRVPIGPGETEVPVVAATGDARLNPSGAGAVVAVVVTHGTTRMHRVLLARAGAMRELFTQNEAMDDSASVAVVSTSQGVIVAWDEDRPGPQAGAIMAQFVPHAALVTGAPIAAPAPRVLTPDDLDAGDPLLVALPNGTAVLVWLAAQDLDAGVSNQQTVSDIWARALGADGAPANPSVQISPGSGTGNRFGVTALARSNAIWLAYRVAGDADQESRGDGGSVAVVRLGGDLHPTASPAYVTAEDAVPTGAPVLVGDAAGVTAFWLERQSDAVHSLRRPIEPDGRVTRVSNVEIALGGDLPTYGDASDFVLLRHGPHGELGLARGRCPAIPPPAPQPPAARH